MARWLILAALVVSLLGGAQALPAAPAAPAPAPAPAASAGRALAELLAPDGTVRLDSGYSGTLDPAGWSLVPGDGPPRFVPAAPGDENWDARFHRPGANNNIFTA